MSFGAGSCFPNYGNQSALMLIGGAAWSTGFSSRMLVTSYWDTQPQTRNAFIAVGASQMALAVVGMLNSGLHGFWGTPATHKIKAFFRLMHHDIPFMLYAWQFFVGLFAVLLPSQWLSSVTFAFVLLHVWVELPLLVFRLVAMHHLLFRRWEPTEEDDTALRTTISVATRVLQIIAYINIVLYMTTGNTYIRGLLTLLGLVADGGNFFLAPLLAFFNLMLRQARAGSVQGVDVPVRHHTGNELCMAAMLMLHPIIFYPHLAFACISRNSASVDPASSWMLTFSEVNLGVLACYVLIQVLTPRLVMEPAQFGLFQYLRWIWEGRPQVYELKPRPSNVRVLTRDGSRYRSFQIAARQPSSGADIGSRTASMGGNALGVTASASSLRTATSQTRNSARNASSGLLAYRSSALSGAGGSSSGAQSWVGDADAAAAGSGLAPSTQAGAARGTTLAAVREHASHDSDVDEEDHAAVLVTDEMTDPNLSVPSPVLSARDTRTRVAALAAAASASSGLSAAAVAAAAAAGTHAASVAAAKAEAEEVRPAAAAAAPVLPATVSAGALRAPEEPLTHACFGGNNNASGFLRPDDADVV